jgi:hypothetical protein
VGVVPFWSTGSCCGVSGGAAAVWTFEPCSVTCDAAGDVTGEVELAACVVESAFAAVASELTELLCETGPSSPGLRTRTETLTFCGAVCVVWAPAASCCWFPPLGSVTCVPEPSVTVDWAVVAADTG